MSLEIERPGPARQLGGIGPAIITASVVIGPGSILTASKIGHEHGYLLVWVLVGGLILMLGMTALSARLGVVLEGTLCDELARRAGRPIAALAGISLFLVAACFQFGNNLGVLAAIEPFFDTGRIVPIVVIVGLNLVIIAALIGFQSLYQPIERLMKLLVGLMLFGFASNLFWARPDLSEAIAGLVPKLPVGATQTILPTWQEVDSIENGKVVWKFMVVDHLLLVTAMVATTFSVGGAFYQSYLVREKGWTRQHLQQGLFDSAVGIGVLGLISLMIMITSAAVLFGKDMPLNSAADVALQLEPAFGSQAKLLFCMGIFAGAFSSFLVNAMIGGTVLADSLGLGGHIDDRWPKVFTVLALLVGMVVAIWVQVTGLRPVNLVIFAQAMTVLAVPVLAAAMLWLATRPDLKADRRIPAWMIIIATVGLAVTLFLAVRKAIGLWLPIINS